MQFKTLILILSSATAVIPCLGADPVDYVNPIIGTNGMGHTFPEPAPFRYSPTEPRYREYTT